jgi:hypothetical protein
MVAVLLDEPARDYALVNAASLRRVVVREGAPRLPRGAIQEGAERPGRCAAGVQGVVVWKPGSEPLRQPGAGFGPRAHPSNGSAADQEPLFVLYASTNR